MHTQELSDVEAKTTGARLALGRARKTHTTTTAALAEARRHLEQAERTLGESVIDNAGADAAARSEQAATLTVRHCEHAVNAATQRMEAAEVSLKLLETEANRARVRQKLVQTTEAARLVDECIFRLREAVNIVCPLMDDLRSEGHDMLNLKLNDAQVFFRQWLLDSCGAMRGCKTGLDVFVKRTSWAETLPQAGQEDHLRL